MLLLNLVSHITFTTYFYIDYDFIFIASRLIDFGADEHEYDEVQDFPEESTANNQSLLSVQNNNFAAGSGISVPSEDAVLSSSINNNNIDLPPELPPPKQNKSLVNSNSKTGKTKSSKSSKSKIPRSPSVASALSYNNFQPPPISGIPPKTPPLPLGYQSKGKPLNSPTALQDNNAQFFSGANINSNIMAGGNSGNSGSSISLSGSNSNAHRNSANMAANSRRPQISSPLPGESPKNFQFLTLTVRKDENGYGMKVSERALIL